MRVGARGKLFWSFSKERWARVLRVHGSGSFHALVIDPPLRGLLVNRREEAGRDYFGTPSAQANRNETNSSLAVKRMRRFLTRPKFAKNHLRIDETTGLDVFVRILQGPVERSSIVLIEPVPGIKR